jgi:hypothetical protein
MAKNSSLRPVALVALALVAGCGGKQTPVGRVEIDPRVVELPPSQAQPLHLTWRPSASLEGAEPTVFIHLLDGQRKVIRTFDHPFPQRWREGTPVAYDIKLYQSALAPPLPPGKYPLTLGLYGEKGKRWPLEGLGEPGTRFEYEAGVVEVPPQQPHVRFVFSPTWLPVEPGGDRQVLARRWMREEAVIRLLRQQEPGTVWLVLQIPPTNSPEVRLTLEPGASTPAVLVAGSCGGAETNLTGQGYHEVELPMDLPPAGSFCRVQLRANFMIQPTLGRPRSISLENLAWIPEGGRRAPKPAAPETATTASPKGEQ